MEAPMSDTATPLASPELLRLEVLRAYKSRLSRGGDLNLSPFGTDEVVRYHTDVTSLDVPAIHRGVRDRIEAILREVRGGKGSQVAILCGSPGTGKSHLINCFRPRSRGEELGYLLVCNSNHWKSSEFEECLLDWVLDALVYPAPDEPHLLLDKVQEIAFQALQQIVDRPGEVSRYTATGGRGFLRRWWGRLTGSAHARFLDALARRDPEVFRWLDFPPFAAFVCKRFLFDSSNPFHRYAMHVLLRYLFAEDREKVLHWLRRKPVHKHFLRALGAHDEIDRNYKVFDVVKILVSLFTPDIARKLQSAGGRPGRDAVFFFAFDQSEAREALFDSPEEWKRFFAQLSELYNALPNVFILFTMTVALRNQFIGTMEGQFKDRIRHDPQFILGEPEPAEVLELYRQRVERWLGEEAAEVRAKWDALGNPYLPFEPSQVLEFSRRSTLRDTIKAFDQHFREALAGEVIGPNLDFLVFQKELRRLEVVTKPFEYTSDHLKTVESLLTLAGEAIAREAGLGLDNWARIQTDPGGLAVLRLQFCERDTPSLWVRVFLVRLSFAYTNKLPECVKLLANLTKARNFLWLVRPDRIDSSVESQRPGQVFARELPPATETTLAALVRTWQQKGSYPTEQWAEAEPYLLAQLKATYFGELLDQISQAVAKLKSAPDASDLSAVVC
jgi:hypothetical protein